MIGLIEFFEFEGNDKSWERDIENFKIYIKNKSNDLDKDFLINNILKDL